MLLPHPSARDCLIRGSVGAEALANYRGPGGQTPLHVATAQRNEEMTELLLDMKADVSRRDAEAYGWGIVCAMNSI